MCVEFWTYIWLKCGKYNLLWLAKIITSGVLHERYEANCLTVSYDNQNSVLSHSFINLFLYFPFIFLHVQPMDVEICVLYNMSSWD